jgi:hypothetical protein
MNDFVDSEDSRSAVAVAVAEPAEGREAWLTSE